MRKNELFGFRNLLPGKLIFYSFLLYITLRCTLITNLSFATSTSKIYALRWHSSLPLFLRKWGWLLGGSLSGCFLDLGNWVEAGPNSSLPYFSCVGSSTPWYVSLTASELANFDPFLLFPWQAAIPLRQIEGEEASRKCGRSRKAPYTIQDFLLEAA